MTLSILLIDNYDSFTFNLEHLVRMRDDTVALEIRRNDEPFLEDIAEGAFDGVIIGPGPGSPEDDAYFGNNKAVILEFGPRGLPILGVCLGFQGIYHAFGGDLKIAPLPMHGKTSKLNVVAESPLLLNIESGLAVMRYHSIILDASSPQPDALRITAELQDSPSGVHNGREIMAIEHVEYPIYGVQFHPESFATESGGQYIDNFLEICRTNTHHHKQ